MDTKEKKVVVSFAISRAARDALRGMKEYTKFIEKVVLKSMSKCPTCGGEWPKKGEI